MLLPYFPKGKSKQYKRKLDNTNMIERPHKPENIDCDKLHV